MKRVLILLINFIIILTVTLSVVAYVDSTAEETARRSKAKFSDTTAILEEIASNYLEDSQTIADMWAALINGTEMTMEEAVAMLREMDTAGDASAHLIWADDLTGIASEAKAANPQDFTVDYSKSTLSSVIRNVSSDGNLHISHRYTNPQTGAGVVSFCSAIRLTDSSGAPKDAILLYVVPTNALEQRWTFPTEYGDEADVTLIDSNGEYVIKPAGMKNENFSEASGMIVGTHAA